MVKAKANPKDIVYTPAYIADFMCRIAVVNKDSVVLDNCCGDGKILESALRNGAKKVIGIEYLYANFEDAKANLGEFIDSEIADIFNGDGLDADLITEDVTATIINPPYSYVDKGMCFAEVGMNKMKSGRCVIITSSSAGIKKHKTMKNILKNNTLIASIVMPDIFGRVVSVNVNIYVFETNKPHDINTKVKFIDMSNDGYDRKGVRVEDYYIRDVDNAESRYQEVLDLINGEDTKTTYYKDFYLEDNITLNGGDWNFKSHKEIPFEIYDEDFTKTMFDYICFQKGIDVKEFKKELMNKVLYSSQVTEADKQISIILKGDDKNA